MNKKLSLTKEGDQKNSEARKEMARILRENRNKEKADRQSVDTQVTTLLNDYTTQKVDGITATKEALRTALAVGGVNGVMSIANLGFDAVTLLRDSAQSSRRSGEEFNSKVIAKKIGLEAKDTWQNITGKGVEGGGLLNRASAAAKISQLAAKFGVGSEVSMGTVGGSAETLINKAAIKFPKAPNSIKPNLHSRSKISKNIPEVGDTSFPQPSSKSSGIKRGEDSTRNAKITTTGRAESPAQTYTGSNQATHRRFNDSYLGAGLQPSVGSVRNISTAHKKQGGNDPSVRRGGIQDKMAVDSSPAPRRKLKPTQRQVEQNPYEDPSDYYPRVSKRILAKRAAELKKKKRAEVLVGRKIAGRINITLWSVGFSVWLIFQLPMALFMLMSFGLTGLAGILFDASELFTIFYLMFLGFVIFQLFLIYMLYKFLGLEPLGGEGSGFKYGALIMVFIGYSIPLLNLLPWFYVWTFAVWLKPK